MIRKTARLENGATAWGNSAFPPPGGLTKEPGRNLLPSVKLSRLHEKKYPQRLSACPVNAIYADHFDKDYLEYEQKKKELENRIAFALQAGKYEEAKKISEELEKLLRKYNG